MKCSSETYQVHDLYDCKTYVDAGDCRGVDYRSHVRRVVVQKRRAQMALLGLVLRFRGTKEHMISKKSSPRIDREHGSRN